jgi:hypothetical protein
MLQALRVFREQNELQTRVSMPSFPLLPCVYALLFPIWEIASRAFPDSFDSLLYNN